ncbi:hypothetical protein DESUT3_10640 [Desulfuromonas versatilis]|uniref:NHL repeat containing protein n=1 Tax=Desulfuromonas versatilis TaxID=2802975 RepID=A0ABM8HTN9_9BACT|nr:hypothetical protein [Desulfuromonas versatilis]BCR03995.1 hypothetical protein DESUT3_10640 [Desulfuromonas versatilis]
MRIAGKTGWTTFLAFLTLLALQGCSTAPKVGSEAVFFPPAPNPPRIQYLTSINDSTDIQGKSSQFSLVAFGGQDTEKLKGLYKPYGILSHGGKIYICDIGAGNVIIIDPAEKKFDFLKGNYSLGKLKKPANVAIDKEGLMYVADAARKEIVVFNPQGDYVTAFGKSLAMKPADVAVDDDILYVLDISQHEIKLLDRKTGDYLRSIGRRIDGQDGIALATNMCLDKDGFIYVTNLGSGKVLKMDRDGHILMTMGQLGDFVGQFARPKGITVDDKGRIYVVDNGHQNVQIFNSQSRILAFFGDPGLPKGSLNLPIGITVTTDNLDFFRKYADPSFELESLILVANQYGESKISVYGLGHRVGEEPGSDVPETKEAEK